MAISHPEGRKLPDDHPLRPGAPMMIFSVRRRKAPSTTSTEKPSEDSSESPKPEQSSEPKPEQT